MILLATVKFTNNSQFTHTYFDVKKYNVGGRKRIYKKEKLPMFAGTMPDDRRKFPRKQVSHSTNILSAETQSVLGECFLTNVSESGFAIESDCRFSVGNKVSIKINMLNDVISLVGEVVRVDKGFFEPLYGVKICDNESENLDIFRAYIQNQLN